MPHKPLSEQFRPKTFEDFVGQERWTQEGGLIFDSVAQKRPLNLLFFGPPGTGKTSLAMLYISQFHLPCVTIHPSRFQLAQAKEILEKAENEPLFHPTLLWIDEIHRLTRPQQDILLKAIEEGSICLISVTTENPSFVLSNALLSRLHVLQFQPLSLSALQKIIDRVLRQYPTLSFTKEVSTFLIEQAQGDARKLLSFLDPLSASPKAQKRYEKIEELHSIISLHSGSITAHGEGRYLLISALHKAVRGSDVNASLYWLSRMIQSGEDKLYIFRRLIRMALEDIGLADPEALQICLQAQNAYKILGSPEGDLALFQVTIYLALSPKSAASYLAMKKALSHAEKTGHISPPKHILNAPTKWMKEEGYGEGYIWDHDVEDAVSGQNFFPEELAEEVYYTPVERGFERELQKRYTYFSKLQALRRSKNNSTQY